MYTRIDETLDSVVRCRRSLEQQNTALAADGRFVQALLDTLKEGDRDSQLDAVETLASFGFHADTPGVRNGLYDALNQGNTEFRATVIYVFAQIVSPVRVDSGLAGRLLAILGDREEERSVRISAGASLWQMRAARSHVFLVPALRQMIFSEREDPGVRLAALQALFAAVSRADVIEDLRTLAHEARGEAIAVEAARLLEALPLASVVSEPDFIRRVSEALRISREKAAEWIKLPFAGFSSCSSQAAFAAGVAPDSLSLTLPVHELVAGEIIECPDLQLIVRSDEGVLRARLQAITPEGEGLLEGRHVQLLLWPDGDEETNPTTFAMTCDDLDINKPLGMIPEKNWRISARLV